MVNMPFCTKWIENPDSKMEILIGWSDFLETAFCLCTPIFWSTKWGAQPHLVNRRGTKKGRTLDLLHCSCAMVPSYISLLVVFFGEANKQFGFNPYSTAIYEFRRLSLAQLFSEWPLDFPTLICQMRQPLAWAWHLAARICTSWAAEAKKKKMSPLEMSLGKI